MVRISDAVAALRRLRNDLVADESSGRRWVRARVGALLFVGFLSTPARKALASGWSTPIVVGAFAAMAVFAAFFMVVIWRNTPDMHRNRAPLAIVGAVLTGAILVPVFGLPWLAIVSYFTATMLLFNCRISMSFGWFIVFGIPAIDIAVGLLLGHSVGDTAAIAVPVLLVAAVQAAFYQQVTAKAELRTARAELARLAVTEERLRIARDLHDILGQQLSAVSLKAEVAARLVNRDPERAAAEMLEVAAVAREALADVRTTVSGYRQMSLTGEIETARALLCAAGITLHATAVPLPAPLDGCAAWLVRESVTNVVRHSAAGRCEIRVVRSAGNIVVEVRDDGGAAGSALAYGNGLTGLAERVAAGGGALRTVREQGWFVVRADFPVGRAVEPAPDRHEPVVVALVPG